MKKYLVGLLILVILSASIYVMLPEKVKISIEETRTKYYVWENESWVLSSTEYLNLYDGTTKMRAKSRELNYWNDSNYIYIERTSLWKDNITTIQTYKFDYYDGEIDHLPIENKLECINCEGKIVHYEIRDILYDGETKNIESPFSYGHNMNIEFEDDSDFMWAKVYQQIISDKIIVRYRPDNSYEDYYVRIFDPPQSDGKYLDDFLGSSINRSIWTEWETSPTIAVGDSILNLTESCGAEQVFSGWEVHNISTPYIITKFNIVSSGAERAWRIYLTNSTTASTGAYGMGYQSGAYGFKFIDNDTAISVGETYSSGIWYLLEINCLNDYCQICTFYENETQIECTSQLNKRSGEFYPTLSVGCFTGGTSKVMWDWVKVENISASARIDNNLYANGKLMGYCNGTAIQNMTYNWTWYNGSNPFSNGTTSEVVSGTELNVANISAGNVTYLENWTLGCTSYDGTSISDEDNETVEIQEPIFINITSPSENAVLDTGTNQINFTFENYTASDTCWWTNDSGVTNNTISCFSFECYQESANESNQSGTDGDCDLNYSGSYYNLTGDLISEIIDGNWSSYTTYSPGSGVVLNLTVNYSKPSEYINNTTWETRTDSTGYVNYTIDSSCITQEPLQLLMHLYDYGGIQIFVNYYCNNGTDWAYIGHDESGFGAPLNFYEEGIYWEIDSEVISSREWRNDSGEVNISIYGNSSIYNESDSVGFWVVVGGPYVEYEARTPDNDSWQNYNSLSVYLTIEDDQAFQNTTYYLYNVSNQLENETTYTEIETADEINWTEIADGTYYFNTTTYNIFNRSNSTETRTVNIDTTYPLINYTSNSDVSNSTADFDDKDWIFVNVSVTELNEKNITFTLYRSGYTNIENQTTFNDSTRTINWTSLGSGNMYFWNVTICDNASNCAVTDTRSYGEKNVNMSVENTFGNLTVELGSNVTINATNTNGTVCVDIDHPSYGTNYSCSSFSNIFELWINWFRKTIFADGNSDYQVNVTGNSTNYNTSEFNVSSHKYDEIVNMSVNISSTDFVYTPSIFGLNESIIFDRVYAGYLIGDYIYLNESTNSAGSSFNDYNNLTFDGIDNQTIYFYLDDHAKENMVSIQLNATGINYSFSYSDDFDDFSNIDKDLTTSQMDISGSVMTANSSKQEFSLDDFEDGNIADLWYKTDDFSESGAGYSASGTINEADGYLKILQTTSNSDVIDGNITTIYVGPYNNFTILYIPDDIEINLSNFYDSQADNKGCSANSFVYLGSELIWTNFYHSGDTWEYATETSDAYMLFNFSKINTTHWNVNIEGYETSSTYESVGQGGCGSINTVYNWTNGTYVTTRSNCENTYGSLNNSFDINVYYDSTNEFAIGSTISTGIDCKSNQIDTRIEYINHTLWNRTNGTVISNSIFDAPSSITKATMDVTGYSADNESVYLYLSADNGINWESVSDNVEHTFDDSGSNLKWKIEFNLTDGLDNLYKNLTSYISQVDIDVPDSSPSDVLFDFGADGSIEYIYEGELGSLVSPIEVNLTNATLTEIFSSLRLNTDSIYQYDHAYLIPLVIGSSSQGQINLDNFNITYNPNPVKLNITYIQNYLGNLSEGINETNLTFDVGSYGGNITLNDLRYDYAGGNDSIEVKAHDPSYSQNVTWYLDYFYSRWDYDFVPDYVEWIGFYPISPTSKNVTPYGQTDNTAILNITNYGYGGKNVNLSLYVNASLECVNTTISLDKYKSNGTLIENNNTWYEIANGIPYLNTTNIWMWSDYDCNYSNWDHFQPYFYFRPCANGTICAEEVE